MARTFHVSEPVRHQFADSFTNTMERAAKRDPEFTMLAMKALAAMIRAQNNRKPPPSGGAPRAATATQAGAVPVRGAGSALRTSASKDSAARSSHSRADRSRAEAFLPGSSLLAHLRANGAATDSADAMLAEQSARRVRAQSYEPAPRGTSQVMTASDRRRAAAFIPPSSLDVYRARQADPGSDAGVAKGDKPKPDDELMYEGTGASDSARARDFESHQAEMRAIAQGKKPATRAAPRSGRPGYSRG